MEKQKTNRREWVKTAAIIFLVILLILTFFSQTIMNRSLPEVATQQVTSGSINAKIRGTGTVSANETYDVTISQTRKVRTILVKTGQQVSTGDVLFTLEPSDSDELKMAQDTLAEMELSYQKSLIEASNSSSTENREVQKLREAYNEALETYRLYSNADPDQVTLALEKAKVILTDLQRASEDAQEAYTEASSDAAYMEAKQAVSDAESKISQLESQIEVEKAALDSSLPTDIGQIKALIESTNGSISSLRNQQLIAQNAFDNTLYSSVRIESLNQEKTYEALNNEYIEFTGSNAELCSDSTDFLMAFISRKFEDSTIVAYDYADAMRKAYNALCEAQAEIDSVQQSILDSEALLISLNRQQNALKTIGDFEDEYYSAIREHDYAEQVVADWDRRLKELQQAAKDAKRAADDQSALVDKYQKASDAAVTLKAAEEALEDKVFSSNLGDSSSLDLKAAKDKIDDQKKLIEELNQNADGQEITANVSGTVSSIGISAGGTAAAETPLISINVTDRGYTVQIPVTMQQAKQVRIGDTANISNYYSGDLTATLENIANDPQNMGKGKLLIFRLTGDDVEPGANITLSIGQKSANYDTLIPNSAVRTDSNGSFVLVVVAKSSPLGNRYVATRADIQVLASDDTTSAVTGISNGDFVITTSTQPIEAGDQVRLADNG